MQSFKYKRNFIDTDLLDYYHMINAPISLCNKKYALQWLHKTTRGRKCMAHLWSTDLLRCRPILVHLVFAK